MKSVHIQPPASILVINYGGIGDILLATPLLRTLRAAYPNATIDTYIQAGRGGILEGNPDLDHVRTTRQRHGFRSYAEFVTRFARRYDLAVSVRTGDRQVLFAGIAGRRSVSLLDDSNTGAPWQRRLLSGWASHTDQLHCVFDLMQVADVLGLPPHWSATAPIPQGGAPSSLHSRLPAPGSYAVFHLAARNPYKNWNQHGWSAALHWCRNRGLPVAVLGSDLAEERQTIDDALQGAPDPVINLAGQVSLAEAADVVRGCALYLGPDTAMTHLAAILDRPTIGLFGHWSDHYSPYHNRLWEEPYTSVSDTTRRSRHVQVVCGHCGCSEGNRVCTRAVHQPSDCMAGLSPDPVLAALDHALAARS